MFSNRIFRRCAVAACAVLFLCVCGSCKKGMNENEQVKSLGVKVMGVTSAHFEESYPAVIKGKQDVDVRPQVSGFITKVLVDEGAQVRKGQVLFMIDDVQYKEAVNVARAAVNVARTALQTADLTARNKVGLAKRNVIGEYERDVAVNQLAQARSSLAQARANMVSAQKNLSYTRVISPSNGVVGKIEFRTGALVSPSSSLPLTTVSENGVIYANFSLSEKKLLSLSKKHASTTSICNSMPKVRLMLADGSIFPYKGKIATISGVIDQSTGSVNVRAEFQNKGGILRSGGTATVLVPYSLTNCIVVPQSATYEVQDKKFVYKVLSNSKLAATQIDVYPLNDGKQYVVTSGLNVQDKILVEGVSSMKDGMQIKERLIK